MLIRSRGRPKVMRPERDLGTPELQKKRRYRETEDALDLMLERKIITDSQHQAGMQLRYFFNVTYGFLKVKAYDISRVRGLSTAYCGDEEMRAAIKKLYDDIMMKLASKNCRNIIRKVCLDGAIQPFMRIFSISIKQNNTYMLAEIEKFKSAMQVLEAEINLSAKQKIF